MSYSVVLTNVGTPDAPTPDAVGTYLKEFLSDPYVIPLPNPLRYLLVNKIIVPRRKEESAKKYKSIWTPDGSPLLFLSEKLREKVEEKLGVPVYLGMSFGNPTLSSAIHYAAFSDKIILVPLYPQYAEVTTKATVEFFRKKLTQLGAGAKGRIFPAFSDNPFFIQPQAKNIREKRKAGEYVLFSFHGLPISQIKKTCPSCVVAECKKELSQETQSCYRAHCYASAKALAQELGLRPDEWSVSFQSRLGRSQWLTPYTETVLEQLPKKGIKNILIVAPSFVIDCLETLEELADRGQEIFKHAGGESYITVPCVNDGEEFAEGLANAIRKFQADSEDIL